MKNLKNKTTLLLLGACSLGALYSFNQKKDVKTKKYEVIRTVNGNVTIHDTIVKADSDFTPNDYLKLLGFQNDENIKVIDFDGESAVYNFSDQKEHPDGNGTTDTKIKIVKMKNDDGEDIGINQEVKVIKHTESSSDDIEMKGINIDSIINSVMSGMPHGDSIIVKKVVVSEDSETVDGDAKVKKIVKVMEFSNTDDQHMTVEASNDLIPDLTVVIVSNGDDSTEGVKKNLTTNGTNLDIKIFPNPAADEVRVDFESSQKAKTVIRIVDLEGKVVFEEDLGEISGKHSKTIDLENMAQGTYIINIQNGKDRTNQKLVIE